MPVVKSRGRRAAFAASTVVAIAIGVAAPVEAASSKSPAGLFELKLTSSEVPGGGDRDGSARAYIRLDPNANTVCYLITWDHLKGQVTAAHIHRARRGATGPHHIDLINDASKPGKRGSLAGCTKASEMSHGVVPDGQPKGDAVRAVIKHPADFYVNLHSTTFLNGARRAQFE